MRASPPTLPRGPYKPILSGAKAPGSTGGLILLVLVMVSLLSTLALVIVGHLHEQARLQGSRDKPSAVPLALQSGLEIALASLYQWQSEEGPWRHPSEEWGSPLAYLDLDRESLPHGFDLRVEIQDRSDRIPFTSLGEAGLTTLLQARRDDFRTVNHFLDRLLDWMDGDDHRRPQGAEFPDYGFSESDPLRLPPNRPILNEWEWDFFLTEGAPEVADANFLEWVRQLFHFYPASGVNINTAPVEVLEVMGEIAGVNVANLIASRQGGLGRSSPGTIFIEDPATYFGSQPDLPRGMTPAAEVTVFQVNAIIRAGSRSYRRSWIVYPSSPPSGPRNLSFYEHPSGFFIHPLGEG